MEKFQILILDDDRLIAEKIAIILNGQNFSTIISHTPSHAIQILQTKKIDFLVCDVFLPEINGLEMLSKVKKEFPQIEVIIISAHGNMETVIEAMRLGAKDYIKKPLSRKDLLNSLRRTARYIKSTPGVLNKCRDGSLLPTSLVNKIGVDFIGCSKAMHKIRSMALLAAREKHVNVLITGENGTGKEIVAQIIHYGSERNQHNFCPVNSAAIPESLLESEFFGHTKGSFTGATEDKKGCFEMAHKGTLFLDEISEMPAPLQAKLLRAIEEKKIKPVGGQKEIVVDFRVISATNSHIYHLIESGKLRTDLFHRLNTLMIHIPPLRERPEDIIPLINYFAIKQSQIRNCSKPIIQPDVFKKLKKYQFPGNVRELRNMVERAFIMSNGKEIEVGNLLRHNNQEQTEKKPVNYNIEQNEKKLIAYALIQSNNNNTTAAKMLGISRDTLIRKKKKYNISPLGNNFNNNQYQTQ